MEPTTKKCSKCGEVKELTAFHKSSVGALGVRSACKVCTRVVMNAYYKTNASDLNRKQKVYQEANEGKIKERRKTYRNANSSKVRAQKKAYYEANSDKVKAKTRVWSIANPQRCRRYREAWHKANPDKLKAKIQREIEQLASGYVRRLLAQQLGCCNADFQYLPPEVLSDAVNAKRQEIKLKRLIKSKTQPNQPHAN